MTSTNEEVEMCNGRVTLLLGGVKGQELVPFITKSYRNDDQNIWGGERIISMFVEIKV